MNEPLPLPEEEPAAIDITVDINPGESIQIDVEIGAEEPPETQAVAQVQTSRQDKARAFALPKLQLRAPSAKALFGVALAVYLLTRLIGIIQYPISFSSDEAAGTVLAADLIRDGLHNYSHELLPTFFQNGGQYNLSVSVYLQVIPYLMFGRSELIARGVVALLTLLAAFWLAWTLRDHFKLPAWWLAPLALAVIPTWFLHSRSGFEAALLVSFYAGFLYYYLNYRSGKRKHLYPALILAALAFYSYAPGQVVVAVTGLALLIVDFRYHLKNRAAALRGLGLLALLALPLLRFWLAHPQDYIDRLSNYGSYLVADIPAIQKAVDYLLKVLAGLNPTFWFFPNQPGDAVHQMAGHAHIALFLLPFFAWGLWRAAHRLRRPEMRVALVALLAAPTGAALIAINANRALTIIVPVVLLSVLGMTAAVEWLSERIRLSRQNLSWVLALALVIGSFGLLQDALTREPLRNTNYGRSGLQFGAKEVFAAAKTYRAAHPDSQVLVTPNWASQPEILRQFFILGDGNIRVSSIDQAIKTIDPQIAQKSFILLKDEYDRAIDSGHFDPPVVEQSIDYPNGSPGFYLVRLRYRDDIQAVLQAEKDLRSRLMGDSAVIAGEIVTVRRQDLEGELKNLFDHDDDSLVKTKGANPLVLELVYNAPHPLTGIAAQVGGETVGITVQVWEDEGQPPQTFEQEFGEDGRPYKTVLVDFERPLAARKLRFELHDLNSAGNSIVHLWELTPISLP